MNQYIATAVALMVTAVAHATVPPVESVYAERNGNDLWIHWTAPIGVDGYRIYRSDDFECSGQYLVSEVALTSYVERNAFIDATPAVYRVYAFSDTEESEPSTPIYRYSLPPQTIPGTNDKHLTLPHSRAIQSDQEQCVEFNRAGVAATTLSRFISELGSYQIHTCTQQISNFFVSTLPAVRIPPNPRTLQLWGTIEATATMAAQITDLTRECNRNTHWVALPPDHMYQSLLDIANDIPNALTVRLESTTLNSPYSCGHGLRRGSTSDPWSGVNHSLVARRGESVQIGVESPTVWEPRRCTYPAQLPAPRELRAWPRAGGDAGSLSVQITRVTGPLFDNTVTVRLERAGQPNILGLDPIVASGGNRLGIRFDLTGVELGAWDILVVGPGADVRRLPDGITVAAAPPRSSWVTITGPPVFRPNTINRYLIQVTQDGLSDLTGIPLRINGIPTDATWSMNVVIDPPVPPGWSPIDWNGAQIHATLATDIMVPLFIPVLPPQSSRQIALDISVPTVRPGFTLIATLDHPYLDGERPGVPCLEAFAIQATELALARLAETLPASCRNAIRPDIDVLFDEIVLRGRILPPNELESLAHDVQAVVERAGLCATPLFATLTTPTIAEDVASVLADAQNSPPFCPNVPGVASVAYLPITLVAGMDPNGKYGPLGSGPERYVNDTAFPYMIRFENIATATAAAQVVVVDDTLDPAIFDLSTFELGAVGFGQHIAHPDYTTQRFRLEVDMRPDVAVLAEVEALLDVDTGHVRWTFRSLEPDTRLPIADPFLGFLPPNVNSPEGDGFVSFNVRLRPGLTTGDTVSNQASIVFDTNAPILTDVWTNTMDVDAPMSRVDTLDTSACRFDVSWEATDVGAGVADVTVYVSDNGGLWTPWVVESTTGVATFIGEQGHTYAFASLARDLTGNLELLPSIPDTMTTVVTPPDAQPSPVGNSLLAIKMANGAHLVWSPTVDAHDYVVVGDSVKSGTFETESGVTNDAIGGIVVPAPLRFMRVVGRTYCGQLSTP